MKRVLVCGGRDWDLQETTFNLLDQFAEKYPVAAVVHGGARGADTLAGRWAQERGLLCHVFPADWETHGRAAGPIRNQKMLTEGAPDYVIAFPGGAGTADMVRRATKARIRVWRACTEPLA